MFDNFCLDDYKNCRFIEVNQLGTRQVGLSLIQTYPASAEKKWGPYYHFAIIQNGKDAGYLNFRLGNTPILTEYDGHIGYRVFSAFQGFGLATQACEILRPLIQLHGLKSIILTCHPDNIASRRSIEKLGAKYLGVKEFTHLPAGMDKLKCRYRWVL